MKRILLKNKLDACFAAWRMSGMNVLGPVRRSDLSRFDEVEDASSLELDLVLTDRTIKDLFFPQTEPLIRYHIKKQDIETEELLPPEKKRVFFGVRPCDAAGLAIDDPLFGWDYRDEYWFRRRDSSVILTIACTKSDDFCMCTSLNLSPDSSRGSDVLLRPLANDSGWMVETLTERGSLLFSLIEDHLTELPEPLAPAAMVPQKFDLQRVADWLKKPENFDSSFWKDISLRCIGCGSCTFLCPTCHCFDIQDEGDTFSGVRRKNWDSCSFAMFTMHTSGHNPRNTQSTRWRQRIMHKFRYYSEKFGISSCSGCGRCSRQCPVDMGITETLQEISKLPT
jgi:ferredoxin